ncbi:AraC family transcriptional regulator [Hymenobacter antarcticus]|uniref:HTH araC/xylS-type domain-containing protein n=1 Tax=Hymenobacter antarcticus TaxID=486270 RepID=A0ABP7R5Q2_9BACT
MPKAITTSHLLHVKNMVCPQCIRVVTEDLTALGLRLGRVELGRVEIKMTGKELPDLGPIRTTLRAAGFELLEDARNQLVERMKTLLVELVHYTPADGPPQKISDYLVQHLERDYHYLSHLFSVEEGLTIEKFVIRQKVERAKELLSYGELNASQIAQELGYSSLAHFSNQFRQVTGLTPTNYQKLGPVNNARRSLDALL